MSLKEAQQFVVQFVSGDYTPEEYATFLQWLRGATLDELNAIADEHEALQDKWSVPSAAPAPEWVAMLEGKLDEFDKIDDESYKIGDRGAVEVDETPIRRIGTRRIWIAAASIVVILSVGTVVYLQGTHDGVPINKGAVANEPGEAASLQTTENAAGNGQKQVLLADGSKVWLNAASSLKYPAAFTGSERLVQLSGEAYFEVSESAGKPFKVLIKDAEVEVLGTHFDIMAYENEPISKTTLIDGAVRLVSGSKPYELKPGEQAMVRYGSGGSGQTTVNVSKVDAGNALDWRNGYIDFTNADLQTVMRALTRYYNVEIQYPEVVSSSGKVTVGLTVKDGLEHNLKILEGYFDLHFKTDGKIVTVTRY
jgi:transmembrane sensor